MNYLCEISLLFILFCLKMYRFMRINIRIQTATVVKTSILQRGKRQQADISIFVECRRQQHNVSEFL